MGLTGSCAIRFTRSVTHDLGNCNRGESSKCISCVRHLCPGALGQTAPGGNTDDKALPRGLPAIQGADQSTDSICAVVACGRLIAAGDARDGFALTLSGRTGQSDLAEVSTNLQTWTPLMSLTNCPATFLSTTRPRQTIRSVFSGRCRAESTRRRNNSVQQEKTETRQRLVPERFWLCRTLQSVARVGYDDRSRAKYEPSC